MAGLIAVHAGRDDITAMVLPTLAAREAVFGGAFQVKVRPLKAQLRGIALPHSATAIPAAAALGNKRLVTKN
jgi:hypothetical protein